MTRARYVVILVLAAGIIVASALADIRVVAASVIAAYAAVTSVVLGMLALVLIAHLTTATWFTGLHRRAELVVGALPALAAWSVIAVPAVLMLQAPHAASANEARRQYLQPAFVVARAVVYWIAWLFIWRASRIAARGSNRSEAAGQWRRTACIGLVVLAFTMTFASFDWLMSLSPQWQSTIYGVYWFGGGVLGALALLAVLARHRTDAEAFSLVLPEQRDAIGKLLLTFLLFWVYLGFAQYIVIWSGDLPSEVGWYVARTRGAWGAVALGLLIVGGAIPFLALLRREARRSAGWLAGIGILLLAAHCADSFWLVLPDASSHWWWTSFVAVAALVIIAASAIAVASRGARVMTSNVRA